MQHIINYSRGTIRYEVKGAFIERFLNLCAENKVAFWQLSRVDSETICLSVHWHDQDKLAAFARSAGYDVRKIKQTGGPVIWRQLKKRAGLLIGAGLFSAVIYCMSLFVWDIEIIGNQKLTAEEILLHLRELGIGIGSPVQRIQPSQLRDDMLLRLDDLIWLGINVKGSRATVEIRERTEGEAIVDKKTPAHIVAEKPGVIVEMIVLDGKTLAETGSSVNAGDILVTGEIVNEQGVTRLVRARAEIKARTWYTVEAAMPVTARGKTYTGKTARRHTVVLGEYAVNIKLMPRIRYKSYDLTRRERQLTLPPGVRTPIRLLSYEYSEYTAEDFEISDTVAHAALEIAVREQLDALVSGGEIIESSIEYRRDGDIVYAVMTAECLEIISLSQDFVPDFSTEHNAPAALW
jgi:similar to stage IV sporulation protein